MVLCKKTTARKISKNDNQTYLQTSKQSAVTAQQEENFLQPAIKRYKKEKTICQRNDQCFCFFVPLTVVMVDSFVPPFGPSPIIVLRYQVGPTAVALGLQNQLGYLVPWYWQRKMVLAQPSQLPVAVSLPGQPTTPTAALGLYVLCRAIYHVYSPTVG